ncbi:MAG: class II aldolase/adducin family protein [Alphaproteobacteria bacterium]|nr:class II aldolase/adducin family protein [Alphaproteobacteria bacterium]
MPEHRPSISVADADPALVADLVTANQILFNQGVVDGFGHVSVRHDKEPSCFLLARSMAPGLVGPADLMAFDLASNALGGDSRVGYVERFIHGEIYRARPEIMSVVHSHSPSVVPFGVVSGVTLRAVFHMGSFIGHNTPIFEIRDVVGDASDMLIRDAKLGEGLAKSLGSSNVVLMRGHGSTTVGTTLRQAVFRAVYTEINARLQAEALRLGPVTYLSEGEAASASSNNDNHINRAWNLWRMAAEKARG